MARCRNPNPPRSFPSTAVAGLMVVGAGVAVGAYAGRVAQGPAGAISQGAGASVGGLLGGMVASFGALAWGAYRPEWRPVGEMAALLGLGGVTAMATVSAFRPGGVFAPPVTPGQISSDAAASALNTTPPGAPGSTVLPAPQPGTATTAGGSGGPTG